MGTASAEAAFRAMVSGDSMVPADLNTAIRLVTRWFTPASHMKADTKQVGSDKASQVFDSNPARVACAIAIPEGSGNVYMGSSDRISVAGAGGGATKAFLLPAGTGALLWLFNQEYTGSVYLVAAVGVDSIQVRTLELVADPGFAL